MSDTEQQILEEDPEQTLEQQEQSLAEFLLQFPKLNAIHLSAKNLGPDAVSRDDFFPYQLFWLALLGSENKIELWAGRAYPWLIVEFDRLFNQMNDFFAKSMFSLLIGMAFQTGDDANFDLSDFCTESTRKELCYRLAFAIENLLTERAGSTH